jgi:osmotically-inducible protein OsmY
MNTKLGHTIKVAFVVMMSVSVPIVIHAALPGHGERIRRSDAAIKIDVERTLRSDRALMDSSIVVKAVNKGVVLLGGTATSSSDDARARRLTTRRRGVRGVLSETVIARAGVPVLIPVQAQSPVPKGSVDTEDDVIRRNVQSALNDLDAQANAGVHVRVEDGVVWLTGSVPTWQGNNERLHAARSVTGVRSVINEMYVAAPER